MAWAVSSTSGQLATRQPELRKRVGRDRHRWHSARAKRGAGRTAGDDIDRNGDALGIQSPFSCSFLWCVLAAL